MNALNHVKISGKIGLGFGLVLILLIVVGAVGFLGLRSAGSTFGEYRSLASASNESARILASLLEAQVAVKDYIIEPDESHAHSVAEGVEHTQGYISTTETLVDDPALLHLLEEMHGQVTEYGTAFDLIVEQQNIRDEVVTGTLNVLGPQIEENLSEIMRTATGDGANESAYEAAIVLRHFLLGRVYVNRYLVDYSQAAHDRVTRELAGVEEEIHHLEEGLQDPARRELAAEAVVLTHAYREAFEAVYEAIETRNALITNEIERIGPVVAHEVEELKLAFKNEQEILGVEAEAAIKRSISLMAITALIGLVLGTAAAILIGRGISRPVTQMTGVMDALAGGDLDSDIPATDRGDEIGAMAQSVKIFQEKLQENVAMRVKAEQEQEARNRRSQTVSDLTQEFDVAVSSMLENVTAAVTQLRSTASSMTSVAQSANEQSSAVAAAAEEATTNVETVSAASEELSSSIAEITRQVAQSTNIATQAVADAEETNHRVQALQQGAQKIGDVIGLITSIAEQTNLLALNATIEAARAGDAGKGFAVVASEVKSLANQTGKATEEIATQIQTIQTSTGDAVLAIENISGRIKEMAGISTGIAAAVEEQDAATQEIARNVQEAATGTRRVSTAIVSVSEASTETGAAAGQVESASGSLVNQSDELRGYVQRFLEGIRAA